ncbi:hypothetical protein [uncultured Victivallis sp.]|uniref:hypothetical protein n=1 Tax=uncultured Victivallis sp. TaxID=354118 RepID=UPI0025904DE6|nr:hypothetical protein [uncultured Victivallis sp.]
MLTALLGSRLLSHGGLRGGGNRARSRFDGDGAGPGKTLDLLHQDYRYVFPIGGFATVAAALLFFKVYRNYLCLGGDESYEPPVPE